MRHILPCVLVLALAGCGDPLAQLPKLNDVQLDETAGTADVIADDAADGDQSPQTARTDIPADQKPRGGLLGFLRRQADAAKDPVARAVEDAVQEEVQLAALPPAPADQPSTDAEPPRKGLFGALFGGGQDRAESAEPGEGEEQQAALPPTTARKSKVPQDKEAQDSEPQAQETRRKPRKASKSPKPGAPDYAQVGPGQTLPYGQVARLCGVSARKLGKRAETYPKLGNRYTLYDSQPEATGPRNFYLTGFDDGCARQFTAALVLFGTPEIYEQIHYGAPSDTQPKAATDKAYDRLKSRICGVGRGKPCGDKMNRLSRDTTFVTIYERFGNNARWTTMLVHDGQVLALDTKS
ncbi:MAG: hypothetical protein N4A53_15360 [Pelagimonas sp.]|jgi:hypothetical protein|nr:hypothetical protein [Pelagimonas sp.]